MREAQRIRKRMEERIAEWVQDHVPTLSEDGKHLRFAQPGTGVYSINFRLEGGYLLVWGDVGDGIYQWGTRLTWGFLAGCSWDYFAGKCRAHVGGWRARGWDSAVARERLREFLPDLDPERMRELDSHVETRNDWNVFLHEPDRDDLLGPDCWEWAVDVGDIPDTEMLAHWVMLRTAIARLPAPEPSAEAAR